MPRRKGSNNSSLLRLNCNQTSCPAWLFGCSPFDFTRAKPSLMHSSSVQSLYSPLQKASDDISSSRCDGSSQMPQETEGSVFSERASAASEGLRQVTNQTRAAEGFLLTSAVFKDETSSKRELWNSSSSLARLFTLSRAGLRGFTSCSKVVLMLH